MTVYDGRTVGVGTVQDGGNAVDRTEVVRR